MVFIGQISQGLPIDKLENLLTLRKEDDVHIKCSHSQSKV